MTLHEELEDMKKMLRCFDQEIHLRIDNILRRNPEKVCRWEETEDGQHETECGDMFEFTVPGVKENHFNHCPFCGGQIKNDFGRPGSVL